MLVRISLLSLLLLIPGCFGTGTSDKWTKGRPKTAPAQGTVTYNGKPLSDASVTFNPQGGDHAAVGRTDKDGKFQLMTFESADGAVPGQYEVAISCVKTEGPPPGANLDEVDPTVKEISLIPENYSNFQKSGLTAEVTAEGPNEFQFDLKN